MSRSVTPRPEFAEQLLQIEMFVSVAAAGSHQGPARTTPVLH